jgi:membrane protease YdiL (CAAX protease family)
LTTAPAQPGSGLRSLLARHPLVSYFLIAFVFSWLMFLPGLLMYYGVLSLSPQFVRSLAIAGLLGPMLSGVIMTAVTEGKPGIGHLLRRIVRWRVGLRWYLFALVGLPMVMVLGTIIRPAALDSLNLSTQPFTLAYLNAFVSMIIIGGPLFEEPGWSGFAQPRLQRLYGPFVGGLLLGGLWALWHLPGFLIPSEDLTDIPPRGTVLDFVVFALALMGLRIIILWVVNNTRSSVLMAILVHASWNTFYSAALVQLFRGPVVLGSYLNLMMAACALAVVLVAATRGRIGYRPEANAVVYDTAAAPGGR